MLKYYIIGISVLYSSNSSLSFTSINEYIGAKEH